MPRNQRSEPERVFKAIPFRLSTEARRKLADEYLLVDNRDVTRLAELFRVEHTKQAIQVEAIARIEQAVSECLGAAKSGNGSLSERGKRGRPEHSARRRLIQTLRNVFWFFKAEEPDDKARTTGSVHHNSECGNRLYEFVRAVLKDAGIPTPNRRVKHNDDLTDWIDPPSRDRAGERARIMRSADQRVPARKERTEWEMPPRIRSIKRDDEIDDDAEA